MALPRYCNLLNRIPGREVRQWWQKRVVYFPHVRGSCRGVHQRRPSLVRRVTFDLDAQVGLRQASE